MTSSITVITGDGKGKTTSGLSQGILSALAGEATVVVQFLKGTGFTGELMAATLLEPHLKIFQFGQRCPHTDNIRSGAGVCNRCGACFIHNRNPHNKFAESALDFAKQVMHDPGIKLLILDEISHAVRRNLIPEEEVVEWLLNRPPGVSVILTGRNMPAALRKIADSVTECTALKHPFQQGIAARRGIEY